MKPRRLAAFFLLGFMTGSLVTFHLTSRRLETLYHEKEALKVSLFETTERLYRLEELWKSRQEEVIRDIKLEINTDGKNPFSELALKQAVGELVKGLLGEKAANVNPSLVINLVNGRIIKAAEKEYRLELKAVVISETVVFYLDAVLLTEKLEE